MKRYYSFRTNKLSLFLLGIGTGFLAVAPATYSQTQLSPAESVPAIRSPRELMATAKWSQPNTADANMLPIRVPAILTSVALKPELAKAPEEQQNSVDSIRVDSSAFNSAAKKQSATVQIDTAIASQPEAKLLQPLKYAVKWPRLQPIKQPKQAKTSKPEVPPIVLPSDVATTGLAEAARTSNAVKQTGALSEIPETAVPKASLAFLRKPMDIANPIPEKTASVSEPSQVNPKALLQPIRTSAPVVEPTKEESSQPARLVNAPTYDFQTPLPTGAISLFVDGPDYLSINQVGEYEIAVANSSADATSVSSVSLQVPHGVEIVAVQREAKIDDQKRTLNWSIDEIGSAQQQRIRFRVKSASARKVDFSVTVLQNGRESQTVSQTTIIR